MSDGAFVVALEATNVEIGLKFAEMFPTRLTPLSVNIEARRLAYNLFGDVREHVGGRYLFDAEHPTGKSEIGEVYGKPQPVGGASPLADQRHVVERECVVTDDRPCIGRRVEYRRARLRRKDFVFLHAAPSIPCGRHSAVCRPSPATSVNAFDDGFSDK